MNASLDFSNNLIILKETNQIKELQTVIRDRNSTRSDFIFHADRLIRLIVEESLNQLPYNRHVVVTPTGENYEGLVYEEGNCGVSIMRSGEAMEQGLRDCCRSIRIGKILVSKDEDTREAKVFYAKFPSDIYRRKVLLMYPILYSGNSVLSAIEVLLENSVSEDKIIVLTLFSTPEGIQKVFKSFPNVKLITSEVHEHPPIHFGQKYFGTD
ncbi:hypothetical protein HELRODRAFT_75946 [Helobdella robusta]|uniref:Uracil phosphoribosyltransferase homolog n=1 Tax=Helobdella robusta TaxID=6412 RepID=T1G2D1_HELRO|nr:hypothetical protein HELRODRAFT_75946 [Helobdella robusta]ESO07615.1 hypothetical protein HELRODRAFT_75946 [Helobdella robusta]